MSAWTDWLAQLRRPLLVLVLLATALMPVLVVGVVAGIFPAAAPLAGAIAGSALFAAGYGWWALVLSPTQRTAVDIKARFGPRDRRIIATVALVVWLIMLLMLGPVLPDPLVGTMNAVAAISVYWVWRATPTEAAQAQAEWEQAQAAPALDDTET